MNEKFFDVVKDFDHILVDNYGVVTFANGLNMAAVDVLKQLRSMGKKVIFLSNATFTDPEERYAKKGLLKGVHYDAFITSGQYANADIQKGTLPCGKKYVVFGTANFKKPEKVPAIFNGSPYELVESPENADFVYCGIPQINGEDRTTMDDFMEELTWLAEMGLPMVVSNPDEIASEDGRWVIRQGSIAKVFGGKVIMYGKPDPAIFDWVLGDTPKSKVLMVGDTLGTDILGANRAGVKSCLTIDGGVTEVRMLEKGLNLDNQGIRSFIEICESGIPDYVVSKIF
ncbi:MAG: TIGR01459 family HAD-type hydrolase [Alphaproteobacteria bacterium]|nr:TIGR01459 family HAD-type hydrolase [Alphaproteobacteria bacterium]